MPIQEKEPGRLIIKAVCFLVPMSLAIQIDVGSKIFVAELLIPCIALILLTIKRDRYFDREFRFILFVGSAYLVAQVMADLWNESSYDQYSRGWSRILFFLINFFSIYILIDNKKTHLLLFCLGFSLGRVFLTFTGMEGDVIPWKIGLAKPVALLVILCFVFGSVLRLAKTYVCIIALLALGLFDILMDFRSHGSILITTAVILLGSTLVRRNLNRRKGWEIRSTLALLIGGGIAAFGAFQFYSHAARSGWLSERAINKFEAQVEQANTSVIVAGRSEVLVYFEAIFDSILLGHGSWPRNAYYAEKLADERYDRGLSASQVRSTNDAIPIHSHVFGSWIEAGVVGGLFWINILILAVRSLVRSSASSSQMRPLYLYGAILLTWDVFFSPFSSFRRIETAFLIVIVLKSLRQMRIQGMRRVKSSRYRMRSGGRRRRRRRSNDAGRIERDRKPVHALS